MSSPLERDPEEVMSWDEQMALEAIIASASDADFVDAPRPTPITIGPEQLCRLAGAAIHPDLPQFGQVACRELCDECAGGVEGNHP